MFYPKYYASISPDRFMPVIGWTGSVSYTRPLLLNTAPWPGLPAAFINHVSTSGGLSDEIALRPIMAPAYEGQVQVNDGTNDAFSSNDVTYESAESFGFPDATWTMSRLLQAMLPIWEDSRAKLDDLLEALSNRTIEDTWLTVAKYISLTKYTADTSLGTVANERYRIGAGQGLRGMYKVHSPEGFDSVLNPALHANGCNMEVRPMTGLGSIAVKEYIDGVLAFADDPPELEAVTLEDMPAGYLADPSYDFSSWGAPYVRTLFDDLYPIIQAVNYEPLDITPARTRFTNAGSDISSLGSIAKSLPTGAEVLSIMAGFIAQVQVSDPQPNWVVDQPPALITDMAPNSVIPVFYNAIPTSGEPWDYGALVPVGIEEYQGYLASAAYVDEFDDEVRQTINYGHFSSGEGPVSNLSTQRPMKWQHDDPEFIGYVPYLKQLWEDHMEELVDYAYNPPDVFDGFYFAYKIKVSEVTRAWNALVRGEFEQFIPETGPVEQFPLHSAALIQNGWINPENGEEIFGESEESCGVDFLDWTDFWITIEILQPPANGQWDNYPWADFTYTLPPTEFFLQSGSAAPLYPTFKGAYVYDLHLKKWGKLVADYKVLTDYQAINTYQAGEQSYARFGVFGGILDEEGKLRLFNDSPSDSEIKYGKIGYYRKGMTTLEEVRVHHRVPCVGEIRMETSIEGKVIGYNLGVETAFPTASVFWQHNGGVSGKWHNLIVAGKYDINYIEFRGIRQGKR